MLLALLLSLAQTPSIGLVFENSSTAHFSNGPDGVTLRQGPGWLRLPNLMLDYELTFEYRLSDSKADAGIVVRSWAKPRGWPEGGYRVRLPAAQSDPGEALLSGRRAAVETVRASGAIPAPPAGSWRRMHVKALRQQISITLDGVDGGEYRIGEVAGRVLFDVRKGAVELRNISVRDLEQASGGVSSAGAIPSSEAAAAGVTLPEVIVEVKPQYTSEALRKRVEGIVEIQAIVLSDGTVGDTRVTRSLDPDLDRSAQAAARQWRFRPGMKAGKNVPVLVLIEMSFTLRKK